MYNIINGNIWKYYLWVHHPHPTKEFFEREHRFPFCCFYFAYNRLLAARRLMFTTNPIFIGSVHITPHAGYNAGNFVTAMQTNAKREKGKRNKTIQQLNAAVVYPVIYRFN